MVVRKGEERQQHHHREEKYLEEVKHKILVMSGKGGVGKSTITLNLAASLVKLGRRVGVLDIDIHGPSIPKMAGAEEERIGLNENNKMVPVEKNGLRIMSIGFLIDDPDKPVIWRGPLKTSVIKQFLSDVEWSEVDYLLLDSPPGTGDEPLSIAQLVDNLDGGIIVTTPQEIALLDSRKAVRFLEAVNIPIIGIVENMSSVICPHCKNEFSIFKRGGGEKAARELNVPFLTHIPLDPKAVELADAGEIPVFKLPDSPFTEKFKLLAEKVLEFYGEG
jgi:Mrp family chromosome partitioning ATPase